MIDAMKICPGSHEEVKWGLSSLPPKCRSCKNFVAYRSVEQPDGWVDVAKQHYANGVRVALGPREGYRQHKEVV